MNKLELYEEIRALLLEPQAATVSNPWTFTDADFVPQVRSGLRQLRSKGIQTEAVMTPAGVLEPAPTELEGMLLALFVAERLMTGSLMQKLADGELGVYYKAGSDTIDTKQAGRAFQDAAKHYRQEFESLLAIALTAATDEFGSVFSGTVPQTDTGPVADEV